MVDGEVVPFVVDDYVSGYCEQRLVCVYVWEGKKIGW